MADHAASGRRGDTALAQRYEQLRQAMLDGAGASWQLGMGLLVTRGMAAWMRAWAEGGEPTTHAPATPAPQPVTARAGELVAVLAQMALAHT